MSTTMVQNANEENKLNAYGRKRIVFIVAYVCLEAAVLLLAAGTLNWLEAWLYFGMRIGSMAIASVYIIRKNANIINKRGQKQEGTKSWDKVFGLVYGVAILLFPIVAGLDYRFGWSAMALVWQIVGFIGLIPAMILPYWAMAENRHLYTTVRLEEGHQVMKTGPYRLLRHPMYVGAILAALCSPLLLGSWYAFALNCVAVLALIVRTALEDRTLQAELPGYAEFTQETRYRLLPGVW